MTEKKPTDWERIEADYRAGVLSVREIANSHGITEGAIRKRAKRDEWSRDLAAKVRARAEELVRREEVRKAGTRPQETYSDKEIVDVNGGMVASIQLGQRKDISQARTLAMALLGELEAQTVDHDLFVHVGQLLEGQGDEALIPDKLVEMYHAVIGLPERTKTMKALAETLQKLITLEREAYGLQTGDPVGGGASAPQFIITPVAPRPA